MARRPLQRRCTLPNNAAPGVYFDPDAYARSIPRLFEYLRSHLGDKVELVHDIHERLGPMEAIRVAKQLEPYRLFFLEDPLPPEQNGWFQMLRQQVAAPIAMGELFNNPQEWMPLKWTLTRVPDGSAVRP